MIKLVNISKKFDDRFIYSNFSLDISENEITCLLGPSGIGKSTLLKLLSGLSLPDSGSISGLNQKSCSYIFQEPRLLPWLTVYDNLDFVLKHHYSNSQERHAIIQHYLDLTNLSDDSARMPNELSGGMKQRVSIARAFACPFDLLLMDEPFNSLDVNLKQSIISSFINLWSHSRKTVVFVTHDVDEAFALSHTIHIVRQNPAHIVYSTKIPYTLIERPHHQNAINDIRKTILDRL